MYSEPAMSKARAAHAWAAAVSASDDVWEPSTAGDAPTESGQLVPKKAWVCMMEPI
jgi:hypothetical protein